MWGHLFGRGSLLGSLELLACWLACWLAGPISNLCEQTQNDCRETNSITTTATETIERRRQSIFIVNRKQPHSALIRLARVSIASHSASASSPSLDRFEIFKANRILVLVSEGTCLRRVSQVSRERPRVEPQPPSSETGFLIFDTRPD